MTDPTERTPDPEPAPREQLADIAAALDRIARSGLPAEDVKLFVQRIGSLLQNIGTAPRSEGVFDPAEVFARIREAVVGKRGVFLDDWSEWCYYEGLIGGSGVVDRVSAGKVFARAVGAQAVVEARIGEQPEDPPEAN